MSIIIENISEQKGREYGKGKQYYMLRINNKELVEFEHQYQDGLSECLRKAADAFEGMETGKSDHLVMRKIANLAHNGGLIGFSDVHEALSEIRKLSLPYWDKEECSNLQVEGAKQSGRKALSGYKVD